MNEKIPKSEIELLSTAVEKIVSQEVLENDLSGKLPKIEDLKDSNKVYRGKVSVLFVDMRESTKLPEQFSAENLVKIYRSYIRVVVQAIRYSGGVVRDFMGDGVLAVFIDDEAEKSEEKAVHAARYITTTIDKILNPTLDKTVQHRISCGIGIHTGEICLSKVGMRGKEQDEDAENEFGIAWIGNSTNHACKQSSAVDCGTIFISTSTYSALSSENKKNIWKKVELQKGTNVLNGYIAEHYYLSLDEEIEPCVAKLHVDTKRLTDVLDEKIEELIHNAEELGKKKQDLNNKETMLKQKEQSLNSKEESLKRDTYSFYCKVLRSGHCKEEYVKNMGVEFWEDNLKSAILAGACIGKDEHKVKQEVSYAMVSIYEDLELYDKAYDFLVEQATGHPWLLLHTVQNIIRKVGYCSRLKSALYERLAKNDLSPSDYKEFEKIKNWIVFEFED